MSLLPINEIATTFDIHRTTIKIVKRTDLEPRLGVIDRHLDEARRLYESGQSLAAVGRPRR